MSLRDYLFYEEPGIQLYCGDCQEVLPLGTATTMLPSQRTLEEIRL